MSSCSRQGDTVPNSPDMAGGSRVQHPWVNPGGTSQGPNDRFLVLQVPHPIRHSLRWLSKDTVPQSMSTPQPLPIRARSFNETSWPGLLRASKSPGHSQTHPLHPQRQQRDTGGGGRGQASGQDKERSTGQSAHRPTQRTHPRRAPSSLSQVGTHGRTHGTAHIQTPATLSCTRGPPGHTHSESHGDTPRDTRPLCKGGERGHVTCKPLCAHEWPASQGRPPRRSLSARDPAQRGPVARPQERKPGRARPHAHGHAHSHTHAHSSQARPQRCPRPHVHKAHSPTWRLDLRHPRDTGDTGRAGPEGGAAHGGSAPSPASDPHKKCTRPVR